MERRGTRIGLGVWTVGVVLFLHLPIIIIILYAFSGSNVQGWPITDWTTKWFGPAIHDGEMQQALWLSLKAGDLVSFALDANGDVLLGRATDDAQRAERVERLQAGVREARRKFAAENTLPEGMTSEQWLELMRGPPAEV